MDTIQTASKFLISVFCPFLKKEVILPEKTWIYHIIAEHQEVKGHTKLIERILLQDTDKDLKIYKKIEEPRRIAIFKESEYFKPMNRYIKIALKIKNDKQFEVITCQGIDNLPNPSYMERIN